MTDPPLFRNSERQALKRCPWLWKQTYYRGLITRKVPTWAWFGTAIHKGLEARYPPGRIRGSITDMWAAFEESVGVETGKIYTQKGIVDEVEVVDAKVLGRAMLLGYAEKYGLDSQWEVIHTEENFQIDIPHPKKPDEIIVVGCGTWDLVVWDIREKRYYVIDHKTRRTFPTHWGFYSLNDQGGFYTSVAREVLVHKGILTEKDHVEGIIFNILKKAMPDERPKNSEGKSLNKDGSVSKKQPSALFHREFVYRSSEEMVRHIKKVQAEAVYREKLLSGEVPLFKVPRDECTRCPVFEMCELDESSEEEAEEFARAIMMRRDPYASHREAMTQHGVQL